MPHGLVRLLVIVRWVTTSWLGIAAAPVMKPVVSAVASPMLAAIRPLLPSVHLTLPVCVRIRVAARSDYRPAESLISSAKAVAPVRVRWMPSETK